MCVCMCLSLYILKVIVIALALVVHPASFTRKHSLHKRECAQKVGDTIKSNGKRKQGFKSTIFQLPTVVASFWVGVTPCSHLRGHRPRP